MNRTRIQIWLKWIWIMAVTAAILWYFHESQDELLAAFSDFNLPMIATSLALLLLAKLGLSENAYAAAAAMDLPLSRLEVYRLYHFTQLGKYIPGIIWQYVSRGAAYRFSGASYAAIAHALLLEALWVLGGATIVGTILAAPALGRQLLDANMISADDVLSAVLVACGVILFFVVLAARFRHLLLPIGQRLTPSPQVIGLQVAIWGILGLSFAVLAPEAHRTIPLTYIIGLFAIAYAVGFVAVFSPAGLGVREGILIVGLGMAIPVEHAVAIVVVARILYMLSELTMAALMFILKPIGYTRHGPGSR